VTTLLDLDLRGELSGVLVAGDAAYLPGMALGDPLRFTAKVEQLASAMD
jgi:hypothetical protein